MEVKESNLIKVEVIILDFSQDPLIFLLKRAIMQYALVMYEYLSMPKYFQTTLLCIENQLFSPQ